MDASARRNLSAGLSLPYNAAMKYAMKYRGIFVPALAAITLTFSACPKSERSKTAPIELSLIKANTAARITSGKMAVDALCDRPLPYIDIHHADIDFQCINDRFHWKIKEERGDQDQRKLRNAAGQDLRVKKVSEQRYKISGSPCDKHAEIYVQFDDAAHFREHWLEQAHCPGQDMKLAE